MSLDDEPVGVHRRVSEKNAPKIQLENRASGVRSGDSQEDIVLTPQLNAAP